MPQLLPACFVLLAAAAAASASADDDAAAVLKLPLLKCAHTCSAYTMSSFAPELNPVLPGIARTRQQLRIAGSLTRVAGLQNTSNPVMYALSF